MATISNSLEDGIDVAVLGEAAASNILSNTKLDISSHFRDYGLIKTLSGDES